MAQLTAQSVLIERATGDRVQLTVHSDEKLVLCTLIAMPPGMPVSTAMKIGELLEEAINNANLKLT